MLISQIEEMGYDHETAVDLKTLPVIKSISETLDRLDKLERENPEYNVCIDMLNQLIEGYHKYIEKKDVIQY
ncbi:MAG: hypothetical protein K2L98_04070 [Bacilli bacterium]|nr:hypothetical protein [Bacilli bacterium]